MGAQSLRRATEDEILSFIDNRTGGIDRHKAKMMREDLTAARRKWLAEADGNPKEQRRRQGTPLRADPAQGLAGCPVL